MHREPGHALGKFLGTEQRAARRACRNVCEGTARKRAQAILEGKCTGRGEEAPLEKVPAGDLALGQRLDNLGAIITGFLRFFLTDPGGL